MLTVKGHVFRCWHRFHSIYALNTMSKDERIRDSNSSSHKQIKGEEEKKKTPLMNLNVKYPHWQNESRLNMNLFPA